MKKKKKNKKKKKKKKKRKKEKKMCKNPLWAPCEPLSQGITRGSQGTHKEKSGSNIQFFSFFLLVVHTSSTCRSYLLPAVVVTSGGCRGYFP